MTALGRDHVAAIGEFAAGTRLADVPADVVEFARLLLVDTLGALVGGLRYPPVRQLFRDLPDGSFAALLTLGSAGTWLDADSGGSFHPQGHRLPPVPTAHPTPHSLPVLMLAAAQDGLTDRRALEVFLVANEVGLRSGTASSLRPGLHPHGVHGPAAAALAGALLRGGSADELGSAFLHGSALPLAATLAVPVHGGTVRNVWTGLGSWYGALAAQLAGRVQTPGPETYSALFDGAVCTDLDVDVLAGDLGQRWQLLQSYLKPYACARWIHPTLDAVLQAVGAGGVDAAEVASVEVRTFAFAAGLGSLDIRSDMQARFSLPHCVATVLTDGSLDAGSFLPGRLERTAVAELAARVAVHEDPAMTAALPARRPAHVVVRTRDGRALEARVENARGNPDAPLTVAEVRDKFLRNVGPLVEPALASAVLSALLDPGDDDTGSLAALTRALLDGLRAG